MIIKITFEEQRTHLHVQLELYCYGGQIKIAVIDASVLPVYECRNVVIPQNIIGVEVVVAEHRLVNRSIGMA